MASHTLFCVPESSKTKKILILAKYSNINVEVSQDFTFGQTNKSTDFLSKFPLGKVPALITNDGQYLFETNAIVAFVSDPSKLTPFQHAEAVQWISMSDAGITPAAANWVFPCLGIMHFNKQATERAQEDIKKYLGVLNNYLLHHTFLVGERISLADVSVACDLLLLYQHVLSPSFRAPFENVNRWFTTLINQPQFKAILGEFKLCETMAQFDPAKFAEFQGKTPGGGGDKGSGKKAKQPKKETPKKQEKTKKEEEAEAEEPEEKKPESKDPFAALPKGSFVMDEWKKMFSNNDVKTVALPYFFEKFDPENYSVWYCEYKFPEELKMIFMTCNLVSGMFQRLDRMRKHAFGSMMIFGENNNNTISGLWIWRGHELAFNLSEDLQVDYESYDWTKLDWADAKTNGAITEYFQWEGQFEKMAGKPFNQGKIFK